MLRYVQAESGLLIDAGHLHVGLRRADRDDVAARLVPIGTRS
jgi:hypothetical protein